MGIVSDDATILKIKHEVLTEVAKLAFAGELDEKKREYSLRYDSRARSAFPLLYLQGKGNYQTESQTGRRKVPRYQREQQHCTGYQLRLRGMSYFLRLRSYQPVSGMSGKIL